MAATTVIVALHAQAAATTAALQDQAAAIVALHAQAVVATAVAVDDQAAVQAADVADNTDTQHKKQQLRDHQQSRSTDIKVTKQ